MNTTCQNTWDPQSKPSLTGHDLCDHCGLTQALVRVVRFSEGTVRTLDFCGHHFARSFDALFDAGWEVLEDVRS